MINKIEVKIEEVPEKTMYLTQHLGNGTLGKTEFDASFTLPTFGLIVRIDKKRYLVNSQSIIEQVVIFHENKTKKQLNK